MTKSLIKVIFIGLVIFILFNSFNVIAQANLSEDDKMLINQQLDIFSQAFMEEDKNKLASVINDNITVISKDVVEEYTKNNLINQYSNDWEKYDMVYFKIEDREFAVLDNLVTVSGVLKIEFTNGDTVVENVTIGLIKNNNNWLIKKLD